MNYKGLTVPTFQLKKLAFTLSLGLGLSAAITAYAAGLGTMTSSSKLGEPLNAEIELLAVTPGELSSIQAALASDQIYQDQMLEKPVSYPYINIAVANNQQGKPVLKLTSSQPITEAFLDMLIQVDWPTGRLVKEYTLLLDPPGFNSNYVSESNGLPVAAQPATPSETAQPDAAPATEAAKPEASQPEAQELPPPVTTPVKPATREAADDALAAPGTLTTARGDTLYAIARQMKPDNVSMEQMLAALYQSNKGAFDGKNMNRLKVGKIIRMPDQAALNNISRQQASQLVAEHTADWLVYKNALSNAVRNADSSEAGGNTRQSAGKIGSAEEKAAPQASTGKDVLKLSAGDEKSGSQTDNSAGQAATNAAKEEAIAAANGTAGVAAGPAVVSSSDIDEQAALEALKAANQTSGTPAIVQEPGKAFAPQPVAEPIVPAPTELDQPSGAPAPAPSEQKDDFDPNSVAL